MTGVNMANQCRSTV